MPDPTATDPPTPGAGQAPATNGDTSFEIDIEMLRGCRRTSTRSPSDGNAAISAELHTAAVTTERRMR